MVLTAYSALSLVTGLVCHHHRRDAKHHRQLDASVGASGPHDFAVRKIALSSVAPPASIASRPYVRDDRETPLCVGRDGGGYRGDLGRKGTEIFLRTGLDHPNQIEVEGEFFLRAHDLDGIPRRISAERNPPLVPPCQRKMADYAFASIPPTDYGAVFHRTRFRFLRHGRASSRPSTSFLSEFSQDVDGRGKPRHHEPCGKPMWADQRQRNPPLVAPCQRKMADYAFGSIRPTDYGAVVHRTRFRFLRHGRASSRPSTSFLSEFSQDVDARDKPGHDEPCGKPMWADQRQRHPPIDKWKRRNTQPLFHPNCWPGFDGWLTRPNRTGGRSWRKGRAPGDRTSARSPGACARARTSGSRPGCLSRWRRSASTGHSRIP